MVLICDENYGFILQLEEDEEDEDFYDDELENPEFWFN